MVRKNIDRRISYKGTFVLVNIAADDRNSSDEFASQKGLHFSNNMFEENGSSYMNSQDSLSLIFYLMS